LLSPIKGLSEASKVEKVFEFKPIEFKQKIILPDLAMVDELPELPPDPKIRFFGRYPETAVAVRLSYIEDPKDVLKDLAEFIYKYTGQPKYDEEK